MKFLLPAFLFLFPILMKGQDACVKKVDKDSVQVFTCHSEDSKLKTIKTHLRVNATYSELVAMVLDINRLGDWQYKTVSARRLKKINDREAIYHSEIDIPVVNNRDFVIQLAINQDPTTGNLKITATSIPDYIPHLDGVVRVPMSYAEWKVKKIDKKTLDIEYTIKIDIGGSVPAWIVNLLSHKAPYESFKAMREKIGNYKNKGVSFIKD